MSSPTHLTRCAIDGENGTGASSGGEDRKKACFYNEIKIIKVNTINT
jgi:hypothetical protein